MKCSCFNRIAKYLLKNNSTFLLRFHDGRIQNKCSRTKYWLYMYFDITDGLNSELDCFFFGKDIDESLRCYSSIFDYYEQLDIRTKHSEPQLALIYSIGRPSCLEELAIKMDLMGI
jgi:hypothetical protein